MVTCATPCRLAAVRLELHDIFHMRRPHDAGVVDTDIHEQLVELDVLLGVSVHEIMIL